MLRGVARQEFLAFGKPEEGPQGGDLKVEALAAQPTLAGLWAFEGPLPLRFEIAH